MLVVRPMMESNHELHCLQLFYHNTKRIEANETAISTLNGTGDGSVKKAVSDGIAEVVAGAPGDFDTLKEMSDWISGHENDASAMNSQIQDNKNKVSEKLDKTGDASNVTTGFTTATTRSNLTTKEKLSISLGKIAKWFSDLKTVAFSGSYNDLSNKPTSLPASDVSAWAKANTKPTYTKAEVGLGNVDNTADANKSVKYATSAGNATKVNNYTVNANVPSGAKFTDTTYGVATTTKTGIVKPDGKTITADKDGTLHGADTIQVDGITITRDDATKVIALAKTLQDKIGTIGNKVDKNYVVNNLTTTKQGFVLDGRQGKALQDQITSLNGSLNSKKIPSFGIENIFTGNPFCIVNNGSDVISVQTDWDIDNGGYRVKDIKYPAGTATNLTVSLSLPANSIVIVDVNTLNGENIDIQGSLIRSNFTSSPENWNLSIKFTGRTNQIFTDIRYMPLVIHLG